MSVFIAKTVVINLGKGDLFQGFPQIIVRLWTHQPEEQVIGSLPAAPELAEFYRIWQTTYRALCSRFVLRQPPTQAIDDELEIDAGGITQVSQQSFEALSQQLQQQMNAWLKSEGFLTIERRLRSQLHPSDEIRVIFEATDEQLHRLPWHCWDFFRDYPGAEMALSRPEYQRREGKRNREREKVRILAILGDCRGIDVEAERRMLQGLADAEVTFLPAPSRQELNDCLWDVIGWDMLFFAGHSHTEAETGRLYINENQVNNSLTVEQLGEALHRAIENGLKLAIFNSCDGVGLAQALGKLNIPQVIVMREPVPNRVAQTFLQYFLTAFATERLPLHQAMRQARMRLRGLEDDFPGASWLPVLCQNPLVEPITWLQLGGIVPCPYRGLSAFQEADADLFFGREQVTRDLVAAVKRKPLVAVLGPSGSGKSSVVFAGLVPRLRNSAGSTRWQILACRPGIKPFDALAEAFIESEWLSEGTAFGQSQLNPEAEHSYRLSVLELAVNLQLDRQTLPQRIDRLHQNHPRTRLLLIVDQFEELYTLCPEVDRQSFIDQLLDAVHAAPAFTLVLTLRADFYGYALSDRHLSDALQDAVYNLGPMSREELQEAIAQPAAQMQVTLEQGLTERLIEATWGHAGRLPLLEFALTELWQQQQAGQLTHAVYDAIGGVEEALANHAEKVYAQLDAIDQQRMRRIFVQLVEPGTGNDPSRCLATRSRVGASNWDLVSRLASERLVVTNLNETTGEETVEVAHEALIRSWGRFERWLQMDGEFRNWQNELRRSQRRWEESDYEDDALLRGKQLLIAKDWYESRQDELSLEDYTFIRRSLTVQERENRKRRRKRRTVVLSLIAGLLAALALAGVAWWGWQNAALSEVNALNTSSSALLTSEQPFDALMESLRAKKRLSNVIGASSDLRDRIEFLLHRSIYRTTEYNRITGHDNVIAAVAFSPDGQTIATASWDKTVKLWKPDGTLIRTLSGHSDRINDVAFSPDGRIVASASQDKTIHLWKLDGRPLPTFTEHRSAVNSLAFSRDSQTIASVSVDGEIKLWDAYSGRNPRTIQGHQGIAWAVAFSPDGKTIATVGEDRTIKLWNLQGELLNKTPRPEHKEAIYGIAFSPNGKMIASASWDKTIKLWNVDGSLIKTLKGHSDRVYRAVFSSDGQSLVSASRDNTIKLWNLDGSLPKTLKGHSDRVFSVAFSPDGETIASVSRDQTLRLWRSHNKLVKTLIGHQGPVSQVAFSPDRKIMATAGWDKTIKLWTTSGRLLRSLTGHTDRVNGVAFSPDGKMLASASHDKTVKLWNLDEGSQQTLDRHENAVTSVAFSPDRKTIASASWDKTIRLWNLDGTLLNTFAGHVSNMNRVAFSRDGKTILSAAWDKSVDFWNLKGSLLKSVEEHKDEVYSVASSINSSLIASASRDRTARLWSQDGKPLRVLRGHEDEVRDVAVSPKGDLIATASQDRTIKLWKPDGTLVTTLNGHEQGVLGVTFSPDGETLASTSQDGTVWLWNLGLVKEGDRVDAYACRWVQDYLRERGDRGVCDGMGK